MENVSGLLDLWEEPAAEEKYMIVGWHQWADAGAISSELPQYLIDQTGARKIGEIKNDGFYLFQIPGTHGLLRPKIKLHEGYRQDIYPRKNEFFYSGDSKKGFFFFLGEEPHQNTEQYADAFLDAAERLDVRRIVIVAGVHGEMPYEKDREVSCVYSLPGMKDELSKYAVKFSNYEGGSTIGTYLADKAEKKGIELVVFYAFVPAYNFAQVSLNFTGIKIEKDYKAWYDLLRRLDHMFGLGIDLSELERQSNELVASMDAQIDELEEKAPELEAREYVRNVSKDFTERPFMPLGDLWERELGDIFGGLEDEDSPDNE
jgi:predicted ATP-grasp superfamily ATP-dependent carboligase